MVWPHSGHVSPSGLISSSRRFTSSMAILSRHITAASPSSLAVAFAATRLSSGKLGPVRVPLARAARGTLAAESELAEREKDLAYERAALALLEAGSRPEEIEVARATVTRLRQGISYFRDTSRPTRKELRPS